MESNPWFIRFECRPDAKVSLFCFTYAGGAASAFRQWSKGLPPSIEVCAIQLPGRENRITENMPSRLDVVVAQIAEAISDRLHRPFAFFGHSMGALISYELAITIREKYSLNPITFFASGCRACHQPLGIPNVADISDDQFIEVIRSYNGTPDEVFQNPEVLSVVLPILRADLQLCETYSWRPRLPLDCPIVAFVGRDDPHVDLESARRWRDLTSSSFLMHVLPGDHFFLRYSMEQLLRQVEENLARWITIW